MSFLLSPVPTRKSTLPTVSLGGQLVHEQLSGSGWHRQSQGKCHSTAAGLWNQLCRGGSFSSPSHQMVATMGKENTSSSSSQPLPLRSAPTLQNALLSFKLSNYFLNFISPAELTFPGAAGKPWCSTLRWSECLWLSLLSHRLSLLNYTSISPLYRGLKFLL